MGGRSRFLGLVALAFGGPLLADGDQPIWSLESNKYLASMGYCVSTAGDVNGDGFDDVMVAAPFWTDSTPSSPNRGVVWVCHGSASGPVPGCNWVVQAEQLGENLGFSVSSAGDLNGDGFDDVIMGDGQHNVYAYHGSASGLATSAYWHVEESQPWSWFGYEVSAAGDVNGDGNDDVIVGSPKYNITAQDEGRVFVYFGSNLGLSSVPNWTFDGPHPQAHFASSVAGAGDVNGDGFGDVIIGAEYYDSDVLHAGAAWVFLGSASGPAATPQWIVEGDGQSMQFGYSVSAAGDVNDDGYDDVIVGARDYPHPGRAFVFLGSETGLSPNADWVVDGLGYEVASAGDVNGDGFGDVAVASPGSNRVSVFTGSASGLSDSAFLTLGLGIEPMVFGFSIDGAGDVNGDGLSDLIVGAPGYENGQGNEGAAFIFSGTSHPPAGQVPDGSFGAPFRIGKADGDAIVFVWDPSCLAGDSDYVVYEGILGDFAGHESLLCSTGGYTTMTLEPAAGSAYYLLAPTNGFHEGSRGTNSESGERPQGVFACLPRSVQYCD
jgi:hypothetical protein